MPKLTGYYIYVMCENALMCGSRPQTPEEDECCGNACNPCIFDVHKKLLEAWEKNRTIINGKITNLLMLTQYRVFKVSNVNHVNDDYVIIDIKYASENKDSSRILINPGQHVIINVFRQSKPFTPLNWTDNSLKILIRIYPTGLFTPKLKSLSEGDEIRVRGPYGDFQYVSNSFTKIFMLAVGSGVAAIYPIAKSIINNEADETRIFLIVGFRSVHQIPIKKELQELSKYWNVECTLCLSQTDNAKHINGLHVKSGRINEDIINEILSSAVPETSLILICGTQEFNVFVEKQLRKWHLKNYHVFQ